VGITKDPNQRSVQHGSPEIWRHWPANSVQDAREIERHFLDQGMLGDTGGGKNANYIYIYKDSGPYT